MCEGVLLDFVCYEKRHQGGQWSPLEPVLWRAWDLNEKRADRVSVEIEWKSYYTAESCKPLSKACKIWINMRLELSRVGTHIVNPISCLLSVIDDQPNFGLFRESSMMGFYKLYILSIILCLEETYDLPHMTWSFYPVICYNLLMTHTACWWDHNGHKANMTSLGLFVINRRVRDLISLILTCNLSR